MSMLAGLGGASIKNDDLFVDCLIYAAEMRSVRVPFDSEEYKVLPDNLSVIYPGTKTCDQSDCSVTMCGMDGPMVQFCGNGHFIHAICLENMCYNASDIDTLVCPQCRENNLISKLKPALPISIMDLRSHSENSKCLMALIKSQCMM